MTGSKVLHFYPGQKHLILMEGPTVLMQAEAWGGPPQTIYHEYGMHEYRTFAGKFVIGWVGRYQTPTWPTSKIPWGAELRYQPPDVQYKTGAGIWMSVTEQTTWTTAKIKKENYALYGKYEVPPTWVFNDFGPEAIRYFKDLNHNGKLDGKESLEGEMFHTSPDNEAQQAQGKPILMAESHGCIHLRPVERDQLKAKGAFEYGRALTIHTYKERFRGR